MNSVVIIGPAHPLRGGLASFNERLARQFQQDGFDTTIFTFSLQYPNFLFPGTTQYSIEPKPSDINIEIAINSVNPFNWIKVGRQLKKITPSIIVVRYWMPFMAPCLGTILRLAKANKKTKIICIADNIIPHEKKFYDNTFTKYFIPSIDAFVTMSDKVMQDLRMFTNKPAQQVVHPLYDNFGSAIETTIARKNIGVSLDKKTILFFGFIRKYKGLDVLLKALHILKTKHQSFYNQLQVIIAGEYYEAADKYKNLIAEFALQDVIIEKTNFIPDSEVRNYLCSADVVIQPYINATQSGVTPLAYHFEKPMIVTNVGALASNVPHGKVGLVTEPNEASIAESIIQFFEMPYQIFIENLKEEKKKYSWAVLSNTIQQLAN